VTTGRPSRISFSSASSVSTTRAPSRPATAKASTAFCAVRLAIATSVMPGTWLTSCVAVPRPMKPTPTMPTRIGLPSAARFLSAVSRIIIILK
jgi:hypothetical protein